MQGQSFSAYTARNNGVLQTDSLIFFYQSDVLLCDAATAFAKMSAFEKKVNQSDRRTDYLLWLPLFKAWYELHGKGGKVKKALPYLENIKQYFDKNAAKTIQETEICGINLQLLAQYYLQKETDSKKEPLQFYLQAHAVFNALGYEKTKYAFQALDNLGEFYFQMKENKFALKYLLQAHQYIDKELLDRKKINHLNTLGLLYARNKQREEAIVYYQKVSKYVHLPQDSVWIGIAAGNMGEQYFFLHDYPKSLANLEIDYAYSMYYKEYCSAFEALNFLAQVALNAKDVNLANRHSVELRKLIVDCNTPYSWENLYEIESALALKKNDYKNAYTFKTKARVIKDSLSEVLLERKINANTLKFEAKQQETALKEDQKYTEMQRNFALILAIMAIIMGYFITRTIRLRAKQQQILAKLQQEKLEQALEQQRLKQELQQQKLEYDLQQAHLDLDNFTNNIKQKNDLLEQFEQEIQALHQHKNSEEDESNKNKTLERLAASTIVTQQSWVQFTHLFEQVYPNFMKEMQTQFPNLSPAETRLLVLTKLRFSTKEMASMLGVSLDAIHKSRYRLRKKLGLPQEDNFLQLIENL